MDGPGQSGSLTDTYYQGRDTVQDRVMMRAFQVGTTFATTHDHV